VIKLYTALVFLPLLGAVIAGLFGRVLGDRGSQAVTLIGITTSALLSLYVFFDVTGNNNPVVIELFTWIESDSFEVSWALRIDQLTAVMLMVVCVVSAVVHWYSVGYMSHDKAIPRFMAYLSLFTFAMLMLVTADNFMQMFFGWEGVGLCSYLLIGFWSDRPAANAAAIKAFLVNRVGDFGFALGIMAIFFTFNSVEFDVVFAAAPEVAGKTFIFLGQEWDILTTITMLLFVGAMGKSAQLGLHTWLPDAMEGPTPVSALIHAATMVTAGVFMLARCSPIFEFAPFTLEVVTIVGATTAFVAATIGLVQNDIKRVIAYSTMSQLGYMFFAIGVSAYPAAIFHLMTHAFFKALLFLGAGSVIHAMSDEQDMRKMGGIYKLIPGTYLMMWIGSLALAGVPLFAGYYSKDMIIEVAFASNSGVGSYAFTMGILAALMTAFYSWRLIFMTFHGPARADEKVMAHVHESPKVMMLPLLVLAFGAIFAGWFWFDDMVGDGRAAFWGQSIFIQPANHIFENAHHVSAWVKYSPTALGAFGILLAWWFYIKNPGIPKMIASAHREAHSFLLNKWYFDELYDLIFVRPAKQIGYFLWKVGDGKIIDGLGPDGISRLVLNITRRAQALQSGYVYHYAFAMMLGVAGFVSWFVFGLGG
jgi:NADH-quinone oxidoreductase subunit L